MKPSDNNMDLKSIKKIEILIYIKNEELAITQNVLQEKSKERDKLEVMVMKQQADISKLEEEIEECQLLIDEKQTLLAAAYEELRKKKEKHAVDVVNLTTNKNVALAVSRNLNIEQSKEKHLFVDPSNKQQAAINEQKEKLKECKVLITRYEIGLSEVGLQLMEEEDEHALYVNSDTSKRMDFENCPEQKTCRKRKHITRESMLEQHKLTTMNERRLKRPLTNSQVQIAKHLIAMHEDACSGRRSKKTSKNNESNGKGVIKRSEENIILPNCDHNIYNDSKRYKNNFEVPAGRRKCNVQDNGIDVKSKPTSAIVEVYNQDNDKEVEPRVPLIGLINHINVDDQSITVCNQTDEEKGTSTPSMRSQKNAFRKELKRHRSVSIPKLLAPVYVTINESDVKKITASETPTKYLNNTSISKVNNKTILQDAGKLKDGDKTGVMKIGSKNKTISTSETIRRNPSRCVPKRNYFESLSIMSKTVSENVITKKMGVTKNAAETPMLENVITDYPKTPNLRISKRWRSWPKIDESSIIEAIENVDNDLKLPKPFSRRFSVKTSNKGIFRKLVNSVSIGTVSGDTFQHRNQPPNNLMKPPHLPVLKKIIDPCKVELSKDNLSNISFKQSEESMSSTLKRKRKRRLYYSKQNKARTPKVEFNSTIKGKKRMSIGSVSYINDISKIALPNVTDISVISGNSGNNNRSSMSKNNGNNITFGIPPALSKFVKSFVPRKRRNKKKYFKNS